MIEIPITDTVEMSQCRPIPITDPIIGATLVMSHTHTHIYIYIYYVNNKVGKLYTVTTESTVLE